ncbi:MAG: complex I NDUFA9 subunit family protein [Halothiobacillaceae bacterium]
MRHRSIVIFGGTGFVGRHLVGRLTRDGIRVTLPTRFVERHADMRLYPGARLLRLESYADEAMARLVEGHDAVINLVGILNERGHDGQGFRRAHVDMTATILTAVERTGVARYLHMSALKAHATAGTSHYLRTKGEAEDLAHEFGRQHGIAVTSFRPSVIFGPGDSFLNRFAGLVKLVPGVFPLACADARFSPVFVGDVVDRYFDSLDDVATYGARLDLCGPRDYRLDELVRYTAETIGRPRRVIGLPDWAARLQARLLELAPGKPFSRDNYGSLQTPSVCDPGCPRQPTTLEAVAPRYLR